MQRIRTEFHISSGMVQFGGWRDSEMMRCLLIWKSSMSNVEKSSFGGGELRGVYLASHRTRGPMTYLKS